jgi:hypothetical protein
MHQGTLIVGEAQALIDERQIETCAFSFLDGDRAGDHAANIAPPTAGRNSVAAPERPPRDAQWTLASAQPMKKPVRARALTGLFFVA